MEAILRAIVLGIVQGLTEFIPVSSSGHLILVPALFKWPDQGLAFDVGLHVGTLAALLVYFARDWERLLLAGLRDVLSHGPKVQAWSFDGRFLLSLALGTVPAGIAGVLFGDWIEANVRQAWVVALALAGAGAVMWLADRTARRTRTLADAGWRDALIIGASQAVALIPGVSRSGATISAALALGMERADAARYAFLLGTPVFVGAAILKLPDLFGNSVQTEQLLVGAVVSAIVGFAAIRYLLLYLQRGDLLPFIFYRFGLAAVTLIIAAIRVA
jgi:undecaprenyl-diphosphatase